MTNKIVSDTANSTKNLASQIAKQLAREPLEILGDIKEQTTGESYSPSEKPNRSDSQNSPGESPDHHAIDRQRSSRLIEALNRELEDIRKQNLFKELQARIAEGEEIPLQNYPQLSLEQKQVLMAQMEAVRTRLAAQKSNGISGVPSISSKPSRRFGAGQRDQAQKEQTRVEKPVPPSG